MEPGIEPRREILRVVTAIVLYVTSQSKRKGSVQIRFPSLFLHCISCHELILGHKEKWNAPGKAYGVTFNDRKKMAKI